MRGECTTARRPTPPRDRPITVPRVTKRSTTSTIRQSLLGNLVVLVALVGGAVLVVSWVSAERTIEEVSRLLIDPTAKRTAAELDRFFDTLRGEVLIGRDWARRGELDPTDHETLNARFVPILQQNRQISSMMVANSLGEEFLLLRDPAAPDVWTNRVVRADEWGQRVLNRTWNTRTGEAEESYGELDYDPRRRIWFEQALLTTPDEPVFWTEPVIFFVTKDPGITASSHIVTETPDGSVTTVVAFDLLLLDISRFTASLEVSENGRAFVLAERRGDDADELAVVGLPRDDRWQSLRDIRDRLTFFPPSEAVVDSEARLPTVDELGIPSVSDAVSAWEADQRPPEPIGFELEGEQWITAFRPYPLGANTFWIGVTLPERDLLGAVRLQRAGLLAVVALVLIVGVARAAQLARRFSSPVEALVRETERIAAGDLETREHIETRVREFRRLAEAQDGMREGLLARSRLKQVERDLDIAREIQRGLLPEDAPVTPGFQVVGWNRPADETGGDYFDWLTLHDGRTLVTLADVAGHGIGPALIVAVCRAYMRAAAGGDDVALASALTRVNALLCTDIPDGRFVTAAVGVLDHDKHELALISAGHAPIYFYRHASRTIESWNADELPLGITPDIDYPAPRHVPFEPGDALVVTTDGFFEWANPEGEQWGTERLERFILEHVTEEPDELIKKLHAAVLDHAVGVRQPDDLTVLLIKRLET